MPAATIASVGLAVTWALNTWKQVEEIRNLRRKARETPGLSESDVEEFFDTRIRGVAENAVQEKAAELQPTKQAAGREHEQRENIEWALTALLSRIERGMTVELRFIPPPPADGDTSVKEAGTAEAFATLQAVASQLVFPAPDPAPIVALPPSEEPPPERPKQSRAQKRS